MRQILLVAALIFISANALFAHEDTSFNTVKTSAVINTYFLPQNMHVFIDTNQHTLLQTLKGRFFKHLDEFPKQRVPKRFMIDGYVYLMFWFVNDEPIDRSFYFTAGNFATETFLYKRDIIDQVWEEIKPVLAEYNEQSYRKLTIESQKEMALLVKVKFARTTVSTLKPYLIDTNFFKYHLSEARSKIYGLDTITYILSGVLLMMLLFSLANYAQTRKREFLYYSIYALCVAVLLILKAVLYGLSTPFTVVYEEYIDYALLIFGYIFYIEFTRMFLSTPKKYPGLNKLFIGAEVILGIFLISFSWMYFTGKPFKLLDNTENYSKYFMIFLGIAYVTLGISHKSKLMNFLVAGNIANLLFSGFSQYIIIAPTSSFTPKSGLFRQSLLYFEIGIFLELVLFLLGLVYKNKVELIEKVKMDEVLKQEAKKQEYEKEIAVLRAQQDERIRISADMHDELGSGVTSIRLLSEIAMQKTKQQPLSEISKISYSANELMSKMNGIIWSMNPGNDTLNSMLAYIRSNASEYLANLNMDYHISIPPDIPQVEISGVKRRNVFLVVKESLNNILKHAHATKVEIVVAYNHNLEIKIIDNGKGMDKEKINEFGNGLKNMQRRMETIGGTFAIASENGTTVILRLPMSDSNI